MLVRSPQGTKIVGRFNPDPLVFAASFVALWCVVALLGGVATIGWKQAAVLPYRGVQTLPGAAFGGALLLTLGLAAVRALHWQNQVSDLATAIARACERDAAAEAAASRNELML
jgi:hypothetical protein